MLAHQLPVLPPFQLFWDELSDVFDWLHETKEKEVLATVPIVGGAIDRSWSPPPMTQAWHAAVPLEIIRFSAANRLCVDLEYKNELRLIEPYSLSKTSEGNILLHAIRNEDGEPRSYRLDRIQGASATNVSFSPKYMIELTASGPLHASETECASSQRSGRIGVSKGRIFGGPAYVVECPYCGKKFRRKTNSTTLKAHKDKNGYPCTGRHGFLADTIY